MRRSISYLFAMIVLLSGGCGGRQEKGVNDNQTIPLPRVNIDHLMYLYDTLTLSNGKTGGIIHIYSEYPDYSYAIEPREGFTCVDDVARAMMVDAVRYDTNRDIREKYERMAEFLLSMQAGNGFFYNFIWHDGRINKEYRTTLAEPNWWSWRAFWALSSFRSQDMNLMDRVSASCKQLADNVFRLYLSREEVYDTIEGITVPTWLPLQMAGDQAALLIIGLEAYYEQVEKDPRAPALIRKLADGLLGTQKGREGDFPYGAYLSWQNLWHAYGNMQAYAMLRAGKMLDHAPYVESALLEIGHFLPYLRKEGYRSHFTIRKAGNGFEMIENQMFPQIAYGFRPMIWALHEAYGITGNREYLDGAIETAEWFTGRNMAKTAMYNVTTGRCFDGIISSGEVNRNAGAESTIEALLSLQVFSETGDAQ